VASGLQCCGDTVNAKKKKKEMSREEKGATVSSAQLPHDGDVSHRHARPHTVFRWKVKQREQMFVCLFAVAVVVLASVENGMVCEYTEHQKEKPPLTAMVVVMVLCTFVCLSPSLLIFTPSPLPPPTTATAAAKAQ
jgi:hypothetical protein